MKKLSSCTALILLHHSKVETVSYKLFTTEITEHTEK